jgi:hypothetical protein
MRRTWVAAKRVAWDSALAVVTLASCLSLPGCLVLCMEWGSGPPKDPPTTIDGPENEELAATVHGWIVALHAPSKLEVTALPGLERSTIELPDETYRVSGPDELGRVVYVSSAPHDRHRLCTVDLQSHRRRVLFERLGDPNGTGDPTRHPPVSLVLLAPKGGHIALGTSLNGQRVWPSEELELWSLDDDMHENLGPIRALSGSWFSDGKRLVVERLVPPEEVGLHETVPPELDDDLRKDLFDGFHRSLQILDIATGSWTWVCWGAQPLVAPDGKHLLYRLSGWRWMLRDLDTGEAHQVALIGALGYPDAWLTNDVVLYQAEVTTGQDPGYFRDAYNHPHWKSTLKAGVFVPNNFRTLVSQVGWESYSFGARAPD